MINSTKGDLDNFFSLHMLITRLNFHFESFWLSQSKFDGISILILIFDYYNIVELNVKNFNGRDTVLKKKYFRVCEFSPFYLSFFCFCFFFFFFCFKRWRSSITQQFSNSLGSKLSPPPRFFPLFSNWLEATVFQ